MSVLFGFIEISVTTELLTFWMSSCEAAYYKNAIL